LWKLEPGDSVGFPAGTGICHTFINNTDDEVRFLVVGEANKKHNRIYYPLNPVCRHAGRSLGRSSPRSFYRMMENLGKNNFLFYKY
jgi:uncharacterized cupin superfamily protein